MIHIVQKKSFRTTVCGRSYKIWISSNRMTNITFFRNSQKIIKEWARAQRHPENKFVVVVVVFFVRRKCDYCLLCPIIYLRCVEKKIWILKLWKCSVCFRHSQQCHGKKLTKNSKQFFAFRNTRKRFYICV